eukprot:GHVU01129944.1.p1 GENE.GHVU01129944.1~~GHVU01129944.1.p1  ORF type:complete len:141 (+),score=9.50 GHVU01129944.1:246-668(+)
MAGIGDTCDAVDYAGAVVRIGTADTEGRLQSAHGSERSKRTEIMDRIWTGWPRSPLSFVHLSSPFRSATDSCPGCGLALALRVPANAPQLCRRGSFKAVCAVVGEGTKAGTAASAAPSSPQAADDSSPEGIGVAEQTGVA